MRLPELRVFPGAANAKAGVSTGRIRIVLQTARTGASMRRSRPASYYRSNGLANSRQSW